MISSKNKRVEITLSPTDLELLTSLSIRFKCSKSQIISQALTVLSSKKKHVLNIVYSVSKNDNNINQEEIDNTNVSEEEFNEAMKIFS